MPICETIIALVIFLFFFFSSRRRHTRYIGDWSSDVCSSDLFAGKEVWKRTDLGKWEHKFGSGASPVLHGDLAILWCGPDENKGRNYLLAVEEIGRASCRERGWITGGTGAGSRAEKTWRMEYT